jgi:hypothetical protein
MASTDLIRDAVDASVVPGVDVLDNNADPTDPLDGANPGDGTATASVVVSGPAGTVTGSASGELDTAASTGVGTGVAGGGR